MSGARPSAVARGNEGEDLACAHLEREGYQVLARNQRFGRLELDVVATDGDVLCFVEVRTRASSDFGRPEETVRVVKQRRLVAAARRYLAALSPPLPRCRFDVVAVTGRRGEEQVEVFKNAFTLAS